MVAEYLCRRCGLIERRAFNSNMGLAYSLDIAITGREVRNEKPLLLQVFHMDCLGNFKLSLGIPKKGIGIADLIGGVE